MTDNSELIDELVALGVSRPQAWMNPTGESYGGGFHPVSDDQFVRDWRVAGALMGRITVVHTERFPERNEWMVIANESGKLGQHVEVTNESLPRAIIEACVEALLEAE